MLNLMSRKESIQKAGMGDHFSKLLRICNIIFMQHVSDNNARIANRR